MFLKKNDSIQGSGLVRFVSWIKNTVCFLYIERYNNEGEK